MFKVGDLVCPRWVFSTVQYMVYGEISRIGLVAGFGYSERVKVRWWTGSDEHEYPSVRAQEVNFYELVKI